MIYDNTKLEIRQIPEPQIVPQIGQPVAVIGNSGKLLALVNPEIGFAGRADEIYTIVITAANTTPYSLDGLTAHFYTSFNPTPQVFNARNLYYEPLSQNVQIKLQLLTSGFAVVGDSWTITTKVQRDAYIGLFAQRYYITSQAISLAENPLP